MLPRRQSIFHLGEEGGAAVVHHHHRRVGVVGAAAMVGANGRRERERERLVVGLQILVHHQQQQQHHHHHHHHHHHNHHHGRHGHAANIVLKQVVRPRSAAAAAAASRHGAVSCSFLKACSLCRRDLSPSKDVYMYRGDQGFCSEECRWEQILVDEARERQAAMGSKERQRRGQAHHHSPHRTPNRGRPPPRKTLAVA